MIPSPPMRLVATMLAEWMAFIFVLKECSTNLGAGYWKWGGGTDLSLEKTEMNYYGKPQPSH